MRLVEIVPNFSEGRDDGVIREIAAAAGSDSAKVLHWDMGVDANRTVMTIVGTPEGVAEAAFRAVKTALKLIDMTNHQGAHPRMGAADVCPFIPLAGIGMDACIEIAQTAGERMGERLGYPVYLYGRAARRPDRMELSAVRKGGYEELQDKLKSEAGRPDHGPSRFNPKTGATAVGVRELLIAFNVNLATENVDIAREIARIVRAGNPAVDIAGQARLPGCRAMGWSMPSYGCVQVSMNLVNLRLTPPHIALNVIRLLAEARGVEVNGSELVGMVPLAIMLAAGRHYRQNDGLEPDAPEDDLVAAAIEGLGLNAVRPFDPQKQVLEYRLRQEGGDWAAAAEQAFRV